MSKSIANAAGIALLGCIQLYSQGRERVWRIPAVGYVGGAASIIVWNKNDGPLQVSVETHDGKQRTLYSDAGVEEIVGVERFYGFIKVTYSSRTGPPCRSDLYTVLIDDKSTHDYPALKMKTRVGCEVDSQCFLEEVVKGDGLKIKELKLVTVSGGRKTLHWDATSEVFYTGRMKSGALEIKLPGQVWTFAKGSWSE